MDAKFRDRFFLAYVECALWSSTNDDGSPLDEDFGIEDIDEPSLGAMFSECVDFREANRELLEGIDDAQAGHDFWLTRNGHGAGFWDRGLGEVGRKLTEACRPYGGCNLYVTDDGKLQIGG